MNMKMIAGACMCAAAIVGCVSLEERLASTDPAVRKEAEQDLLSRQNYVFDAKERMDAVKRVQDEEVLCNFAMTIVDPQSERYQDRRPEAMVAVEKITKDELLSKIAVNGASSKIRSAAFDKIKKDDVKEQVKKSMDARAKMEQAKLLQLIVRAKQEGDKRRLKKLIMMLDFSRPEVAKEILSKHQDLFNEIDGLEGKVCSCLKEDDAIRLLTAQQKGEIKLYSDTAEKVMQRLLDVTENVTILYDLYNERFGNYPGSKGKALQKLVANADKISDKAIIIALLQSGGVKEEASRKKLISKLPSGEAEIYALNECKDDKAFYEAFKKANDEVKGKVFERALSMKDETLLADFVRNNPSAASKVNFRSVKTSELASALLDTVQDVLLEGSYTYGTMHSTVDWFVFELVQKLDAKGRAKYLKVAKENLEAVKKDNVVFCDKFYVNMPVMDYVVISFEENLAWTQKPGAVIDYLDGYADMKTDISGKDWRKEWKIKSLVFIAKDRQKYFNVKGTREGLLDFVEKYIDKSASITDTTLSRTGWWQYNDDKHGLSVFVNDNSGVLEIDRR